MYSEWKPEPRVGQITIKPCYRAQGYQAGYLICDSFDDGLTWFVWHIESGIVDRIFHAHPNTHGWSPSEAHAKTYVRRGDTTYNPFELDNVP
jgi:hypothetical protein